MEVKPVESLHSSVETSVGSLDSKTKELQKVKAPKKAEKGETSPQLEEVVKELKEKLKLLNTQLQIEVDRETNTIVVKVIDKETNEVIRQIPPEYVLKIAKYLDEIAGLLFSEKV